MAGGRRLIGLSRVLRGGRPRLKRGGRRLIGRSRVLRSGRPRLKRRGGLVTRRRGGLRSWRPWLKRRGRRVIGWRRRLRSRRPRPQRGWRLVIGRRRGRRSGRPRLKRGVRRVMCGRRRSRRPRLKCLCRRVIAGCGLGRSGSPRPERRGRLVIRRRGRLPLGRPRLERRGPIIVNLRGINRGGGALDGAHGRGPVGAASGRPRTFVVVQRGIGARRLRLALRRRRLPLRGDPWGDGLGQRLVFELLLRAEERIEQPVSDLGRGHERHDPAEQNSLDDAPAAAPAALGAARRAAGRPWLDGTCRLVVGAVRPVRHRTHYSHLPRVFPTDAAGLDSCPERLMRSPCDR